MSPHHDARFTDLMAEVMSMSQQFGHREHVHLTWLAVTRLGTATAVGVVSEGIQRTTRYAGSPQKYHDTVSRAWVGCVGYHADEAPQTTFAEFAAGNPALMDKRLLARFYRSTTLASEAARTGWVEPDLKPFPWQSPDQP